VWYNYRFVPAVTMIRQLLDEKKFGRIFHYRAQFLQDWTISRDLPQGGGLVGDLEGNERHMQSGNLVAGSPKIFAQLLQALQPHLTARLRGA
jgi:hypothetical protein